MVGTMTIPDMELVVPIHSFSQQIKGAGRLKDSSGDVTVTIPLDGFSPRIAEAVSKGRHFDTITVTIGSQLFTLHGVVIESLQMTIETFALSLNFTSIEVGKGG